MENGVNVVQHTHTDPFSEQSARSTAGDDISSAVGCHYFLFTRPAAIFLAAEHHQIIVFSNRGTRA